ncbi:hypothetical protein CAPTEDRAFT_208385 [Capitella teleta]|uniref:NYN domain-containing protein n=1 Tax=Capitella teleta TaxID=283909 RepID=R7V3F0_CAPTE|nr:hypothetical protein CAPTEDRAFT_208385 [Capitella teleta]|eukprot:ELU10861.1 hypothetical protein CAPTEDRAFT_208385 [Capitella teleta]
MWKLHDGTESETPSVSPTTHVLDGGSLLHRVPWKANITYANIASAYVDFTRRNYGVQRTHVIFDGYLEGPSTKDVAHLRRSKGIVGQPVNVAPEMLCSMKKEAFLANPQNKAAFIQLLGVQLNAIGITVHYARGDADLLIVCTAIELAKENHVTVVGEDTDLIVLLLHHAPNSCQTIVLKSDIHRSIKSHKPAKQWHIHSVQ